MSLAYEELRKEPLFKPLFASWRRFQDKGVLAEEWKDFRPFFEWGVEQGYELGAKIHRTDKRKLAAPDNCHFVLPEDDGLECIKGGSANKPCKSCPYDTMKGCGSWKVCKRYKAWLNKSWDDFRKVAVISEVEG